MPAGTLDLNGTELECMWYTAPKVPAVSIRPVTGIWEQSAAFDDRSPNFYYHVTFECFNEENTPWEMKKWLSELRDLIGEGPFDATFTRTPLTVDFYDLRWMENPEPAEPNARASIFTIAFYTNVKPDDGT